MSTTKAEVDAAAGMVTLTIDGAQVMVPKGTLAIRAAETLGIVIPRFCDHPLLDPAGACRQCIVEVPDMGNGRGNKSQASCTLEVAPGMVLKTANTSEVARKAQEGMLELLLINHPLDCPICDKGGECPLQNQAMSHGPGESRYEGVKRTFPKPVNISAQILLDRERCVLCQRCTRFSTQISGDPFITLAERGALSQIAIYADHPYDSYFSGNIIQICPVGALTSVDYRFQARPFDLVSTTTTCEHCASGCQLRTDHRHFRVKRRLAGDFPDVNEEWNCDKGRFGFVYHRQDDRLTTPLVRRDGKLEPASWPEALDVAATALLQAGDQVGVLTGGRLTLENAFAYSKFARAVLATNNIDFRVRPISDEETQFLTARASGGLIWDRVDYRDLENATKVVLVAFEPEDESPIVFLRLRKAWRKHKLQVISIAPFASRGTQKMGGRLVPTVPREEAAALAGLAGELDANTIILVGERAATCPGLLAEVTRQSTATGARYAWVPRRAGEVGAIQAGCLPGLLPAGRLVSDPRARLDLQAAWGVAKLPQAEGLNVRAILGAAASGQLKALVVAGVSASDFPYPSMAQAALDQVDFVLSLEQRISDITVHADVVLPVASIEEQIGTFVNWAGQPGPVGLVNTSAVSPMPDVRALAALADSMGADLGMRSPAQARVALAEISDWSLETQPVTIDNLAQAGTDYAGPVLSTWRVLIDQTRGLDGADELLATAPTPVIRMSAATALRYGVTGGSEAKLSTASGSWSAPAQIIAEMVDDVVWAPMASGVPLSVKLRVRPGDRVELSSGGVA